MNRAVCKNCGASDHDQKFCYERPKKGASVKAKLETKQNAVTSKALLSTPEEQIEKHVKQPTKSRYQEDAYFGQHTSVWGSYWNEVLGWGFACCFSNQKTQECLGEKGKRKSLTKEYMIKRQIEETPLVDQALKQGPVNLAELYRESNLREGPPVDLIVGPKLQQQISTNGG